MNILITGCGSGLGLSLSKNKNHTIFPHYRTGDTSNQDFLIGDLNEPSFLNRFSDFIVDKNVEVFINNAGVYLGDSLENNSDEQIVNTLTTNLITPILLTKRVFSYFKNKGSGLIVNINSLAGKTPSAKESIYCASKFGLHGFSKSLQIEAIGTNIEIVDLYPGAIQTRMTSHRPNHNSLMSPDDVSELIYDVVDNNKSYYLNEIVIRRKVK